MKFAVLALDYDGTIAGADGVSPAVRQAIAAVRAQGVVVILVTGRILKDLRRVAGDLHFADAVVGENGAVIEFPASGYGEALAAPPPDSLIEALGAEQVPIIVGQSVIEADAGQALRILALIRKLELPLVVIFNRGRLMVLPQAVSKATGLRHALAVLRLSPHNAVAIGDAENDHELLRVCEVGVAVKWGSPVLQAAADYVAPGTGPESLAPYLASLAASTRLPARVNTRRRLRLGYSDDGRAFELAIRGRNELIAGDPRSGKSWVAGLICEQLILKGYCLCILDPEGDYVSLEALPGVSVFGGADPLPRPRDLLRALRHPDGSVVVDLSHVSHHEKLEYLRNLLPGLAMLRRKTGLPHRVLLDEAHYLLHGEDAPSLVDLELGGYTLVTYRASQVHPELLAATQAIVVTRESDPREVEALTRLCSGCMAAGKARDWPHLFGRLVIGEAVVLPVTEEVAGQARHINLAPRLTPHARHASKYVDIPVAAGRGFVFGDDKAGQPARTLREFVVALDAAPLPVVEQHLRRSDFSKWVADVFGDYPLAATLRALERDYRRGRTNQWVENVGQAIRSRYDFMELDPSLAPNVPASDLQQPA